MDGDGDLDIVAGNDGEQNVVYLNDGAGTFRNLAPSAPGHDTPTRLPWATWTATATWTSSSATTDSRTWCT